MKNRKRPKCECVLWLIEERPVLSLESCLKAHLGMASAAFNQKFF